MTSLSLLIFCCCQADTHLPSYRDVSRPESTAPVSQMGRGGADIVPLPLLSGRLEDGHPVVGVKVIVGPSTQHLRQSGQPVKGEWANDGWAQNSGEETRTRLERASDPLLAGCVLQSSWEATPELPDVRQNPRGKQASCPSLIM